MVENMKALNGSWRKSKSKRAARRYHRSKKLQKVAKDLLEFYHYSELPPDTLWEVAENDAHYRVDNRKVCSCWMCCNQRKVTGPSFKEVAENFLPNDEKELLGNFRHKLNVSKKGYWK